MQSTLTGLFAGKREVVQLLPKRGPGRPPKIRPPEAEDPIAQSLQVQCQPNEYSLESTLMGRRAVWGRATQAMSDALGKPFAELRIPGAIVRRRHEGPQIKLSLCLWMKKTHDALGGTEEAWMIVLRAAAEEWSRTVIEIKNIWDEQPKWKEHCLEYLVLMDFQ